MINIDNRFLNKEVVGWSMYDFANSAFATTILAVIFNRYYAGVVAGGETGILILGHTIPGAAIFSFVISVSMFIVAVSAPFLGAIADYSNRKKQYFFVFFLIGVVFTAAMITVKPGLVLWGGILLVLANVGFASGNVFYNSFLVDISPPDLLGRISGFGWGLGYLGGGLLLSINLIMLKYPNLLGFSKGTFTVHHCFFSVALWWGIFAIPTFLWVKERKRETYNDEIINGLKYFSVGINRLRETIVKIRTYQQLLRFLIAFLIYNDGIQTVIILASIFGAEELKMKDSALILFFLMIQGTAFIGAFIMGYLSDKIGNKKTLIICLFTWSFIVTWAYGIGITGNAVKEFWVLGILAGLVMGGSQASSRSLAASMTPQVKSAEFFGFYAVAGKFASIFGPLIYGLIVTLTGSLRFGILSLIIFFIIGLSLLLTVNEEQGIAEKEKL